MAWKESSSTALSLTRDRDPFNALGMTRRYPPGTRLYRQDTPARHVYLIRDGMIKLSHLHQDGREIIIGLSHRGKILATATVILEIAHPVTAVTLTPCSIHSVSAEDFLHLIKTDPQFSFHLHRIHCGEINEQVSRLAELSLLTARERLERLLGEIGLIKTTGSFPDEVPPGLPLKNWELAELLAVTPEHLCRLLRLMRRDRNVPQEKPAMKVRNPKRVA